MAARYCAIVVGFTRAASPRRTVQVQGFRRLAAVETGIALFKQNRMSKPADLPRGLTFPYTSLRCLNDCQADARATSIRKATNMSKIELTIPAKDHRLLTCPCGILTACIPASFILTDRIATLTFICANEHRSTVTFEENRDTFVSINPDK